LGDLSLAEERIGTGAQNLGFLAEALRALDADQSELAELLRSEPQNPKLHRRRALVDHYRSQVYYDESSPDLGDPASGLESARQYLDRANKMVSGDPNDVSARLSQAIASYQVSFCLRESDAASAVAMARDAVRILDGLLASGKTSYLITSRRLHAMIRLGQAELKLGHVREARRIAELALAGERSLAGRNAPESDEHVILVSALTLAGQTNAASGNGERAESLLREARTEAQSIAKEQELTDLIPLSNSEGALGTFYANRHRTAEARACYARLVDLWKPFPESNVYVQRQKAAAARLLASLPN
jgi:tetratricopeptide (TPR) repeat protein